MVSVKQVDALRNIYKHSRIKHQFVKAFDYIRNPKESGYRSIHLVYRYMSDRKETYNGLRIEIQLRSRLQHMWATAVETVGTFLEQSLKSSQGQDEWLYFFKLMGSAMAFQERQALVPETPTSKTKLIRALRTSAKELDVKNKLTAYMTALHTPTEFETGRGLRYFLLNLDPREGFRTLTIMGYRAKDLGRASNDYLLLERSLQGKPGAEAVLVSVESLDALRRAYPNYFLDTQVFLAKLDAYIG